MHQWLYVLVVLKNNSIPKIYVTVYVYSIFLFFQISACGSSSTDLHYIAFIAGNDLCSAATEFLCHVFYCANLAKAKEIINAIAEGFERTQYAV